MRCLLFLISTLLYSCNIPKEVIEKYTQCYNGQINKIDDLCNINGYYLGRNSAHLDMPGGWSLILFKDGTCANNILAIGQKDMLRGKDFLKMSTSPSWGTYIIHNRTIVAQIFSYSSIHQSNIYEYTYKIINDTTLWQISSRRMRDGKIWLNDSTSNRYIKSMKLIKLENKPDSSCWLKEKEWFWCDKEKYKEYMAKLKEEKKKVRKK